MKLENLQPGDLVFAAVQIKNDGTFPDLPENGVIAESGARGVLINSGHLEENPSKSLFLVRFEKEDGTLGPPTGCWPEELEPPMDSS